jgi:hypothetical protein
MNATSKKIGRDGTPIRAAKIRNLDGGTIPVLVSRRKSLASAIKRYFNVLVATHVEFTRTI